MRRLPQAVERRRALGVNQSLRFALVIVTIAMFLRTPIYSNYAVNQANNSQARQIAEDEACCCGTASTQLRCIAMTAI